MGFFMSLDGPVLNPIAAPPSAKAGVEVNGPPPCSGQVAGKHREGGGHLRQGAKAASGLECHNEDEGGPDLFTNRFSLLLRGESGLRW